MSNKIPVGRTITGAYGFAFGNIINNVGTILIPTAILCAIVFVFQAPYMNALTGLTSRDPQAVLRIMPFFFGFMLLFVLLITGIYAGLTKEALGLRTGSAFLQFPFGADTWRLLGANILFFLVMIVIYIAVILVELVGVGVLAAVAGKSNNAGGATAAIVLVGAFGLFVFCAFVYISTRFSFLLAPVTIAEKRISLIRAWQLTKGSFWRIFVIMLALLIPLVIIEVIYISVMFRDLFAGLHAGATPDQLQQQELNVTRQMMENQSRYWYITFPLGIVVTAIVYGMFAGASAAAYKAVVPSDGTAEAEIMS